MCVCVCVPSELFQLVLQHFGPLLFGGCEWQDVNVTIKSPSARHVLAHRLWLTSCCLPVSWCPSHQKKEALFHFFCCGLLCVWSGCQPPGCRLFLAPDACLAMVLLRPQHDADSPAWRGLLVAPKHHALLQPNECVPMVFPPGLLCDHKMFGDTCM